jgi:hypothetical protein
LRQIIGVLRRNSATSFVTLAICRFRPDSDAAGAICASASPARALACNVRKSLPEIAAPEIARRYLLIISLLIALTLPSASA